MIRQTATVALLMLGLSACSTTQPTRDRIVKAPAACADETVHIYFESRSAEVTKEGRAVLNAAARDTKACKVTAVDVLGLADAVSGTTDDNLELSKKRAQAVTEALTAAGLPAAEFKVAAAGDAGATNASGDLRPLRRRADIVLHLSPK
jgi:outer membrane protein OmpA-like peptidoglycan-associated protein